MHSAIAQLQELFPLHSSSQIRNAILSCSTAGIDAAAEILLQQEPSPAADHRRDTQSSTNTVPVMPSTNTQQAKPSWAALRSSPTQQQAHHGSQQSCRYTSSSSSRSAPSSPAQPTPVYVNRQGLSRPKPPNLIGDAFPSLDGTDVSDPMAEAQDASAAASIAAAGRQQHQLAAGHGSTGCMLQQRHQKCSATDSLSHMKRSSSATSFAEVARKQQQRQEAARQRQQQQQQFGTLQLQPPRPPKSPMNKPSSQQGSMNACIAQLDLGPDTHSRHSTKQPETGIHNQQQSYDHHQHQPQATQQCDFQQLADLHPWCDPELLQEVLSSVHHDAAAAAAALLQMAPAGPESQAGSSSSSSPSSSRTSSRPSSPLLGGIDSCQTGSHRSTYSAAPTDNAADQQQQPEHLKPASGADIYHAIRGEALRLTRKWQKLLRRSAAAYAAGDRSAAKQLSNEANAVKEAADAAHADAALKIEVMHNMSSSAGLWELDLHGLHVREALTALHQRLELLQSIVQDLTAQPPPSTAKSVDSATADGLPTSAASSSNASSAVGVTANFGRTKQQALKQLLLSEQQPRHLQQAALSQQLRVIVGKGNNSSGGEASLPRAVESWLHQAQYKYVLRVGAIDVKLKRFYQQQL